MAATVRGFHFAYFVSSRSTWIGRFDPASYRAITTEMLRVSVPSSQKHVEINAGLAALRDPPLRTRYCTSSGSVPVGWPEASVVILSTRASA